MGYSLELKGFDSTEVGEYFELPFSFIEMLRSPWGVRIDANELYKHGGELNRYLLDKTPLKNTRKYVNVYVNLQFITPELLPVPTWAWHCDGSNVPFLADDIFHTCVVQGEQLGKLATEFLPKGMTLDIPDEIGIDKMDHEAFRVYMEVNKERFGVTGQAVEPGKMVTWTSRHLHRAPQPDKDQFRLYWKVAESDHLLPLPYDKAVNNHSIVTVGDNGEATLNIEQGPRGIILRGLRV